MKLKFVKTKEKNTDSNAKYNCLYKTRGLLKEREGVNFRKIIYASRQKKCNYFISLADAYGCKIEVNSATALAKPRYNKRERQAVYSCTPAHSSTQYEVHVLVMGLGGFNNTAPRIRYAMVNIVSRRQTNRPVVLVLGTYVPVNWFLNMPPDIFITKLILVSTLAKFPFFLFFNIFFYFPTLSKIRKKWQESPKKPRGLNNVGFSTKLNTLNIHFN